MHGRKNDGRSFVLIAGVTGGRERLALAVCMVIVAQICVPVCPGVFSTNRRPFLFANFYSSH